MKLSKIGLEQPMWTSTTGEPTQVFRREYDDRVSFYCVEGTLTICLSTFEDVWVIKPTSQVVFQDTTQITFGEMVAELVTHSKRK